MTIGKVVGKVVCTPKHEALTGIKLLIVRRYVAGKPADLLIAGDSLRQTGVGEFVYMVDGTEAGNTFRSGLVPVDWSIVGIIDHYNSIRCTLE